MASPTSPRKGALLLAGVLISLRRLPIGFGVRMACWYPSPYWKPSDQPQPESPHQAAIAQPVKQEEPKRRVRKSDSEG
jgi:hypothetical protein